MKLRPHRQTSAKRVEVIAGKLAKRYYGSFHVQERIGPVAYQLGLSETAQIHPIFHCSVLKLFHGSPENADVTELPTQFANHQPLISPLAILDYRQTSPSAPWEVLVQWKWLSLDETSWEDWSQLCNDFHLEDKVNL